MELNSRKVTVNKSAPALCEFLTDVKNFESLMPDNVGKFEVLSENRFVFALKGMPEIALEVKEVQAPEKVVLGSVSDKIPFTLTGLIEAIDEEQSSITMAFQGEFSGMMGMMIKGPISKFIETLASNLEDQ